MLLATVLVLASCKKDSKEALPDNPTLSLSKSEIFLNLPNDTTLSIEVESNVDWVAIKEGDGAAQWLTVDPENGKAGIEATTVKIILTRNETTQERVAAIHFNHNKGSKRETLTITQSPQLSALGRDSLVLMELYNTTQGYGWKYPWDIEQPISTWRGVVVVPKAGELRITELYLEDQNITAPLPESIKDLTELTIFVSKLNKFGTELPLFFAQMPKLTSLILGESGFTGAIPEQYYDLTQLTRLQLEDNKLSGGLSPKISQLNKLTNLSFGNCGLSGPIPTSIGSMTALEEINLFGNKFEGTLPAELGNIPTIKYIRVEENPNLTGGIPETWGQIDSLRVLNISNNVKMTGPLPASLSNCDNLWELIISFSGTTGTIPEQWVNAPKLVTFQAYNTQLSGELPKWTSHPSLKNLIIRNNVPLANENPYPYNNNFTGTIPDFVAGLEIFNARNCNFSGTLSQAIANSKTLQYIDLANNLNMEGNVPSNLWLSTNLVDIDLSGTKLSGTLPTDAQYKALQSSLALQTMNIENCAFEGPIPTRLFDPTVSSAINVVLLAGNNFTAEVPATIAQTRDLQRLSLARNRLSGVFPSEIKTMEGWRNVNMWNPRVNICPQQSGPGWGFQDNSCTNGTPE